MFKGLLINIIALLLFSGVMAQVPANDNPCNAISIPVGNTCNFTQYTNANATASAGVPAPGCADYLGGDVWFSLTVPPSGAISINTNTGVVTDGGMAVYSGTCNNLTLLDCDDDNSSNGLMPLINLSGLTPGSVVYVRFWEFGNNINGTFSICANAINPPANDNPCNAIPIPVNSTCTYSTFSNANASPSANVPAPGCANYSGGDVWFTVTVPPTGALSINTQTGVVTDGGMAIYSGTCNNLTLLGCDDDNSPNGLMPLLNQYNLTPGATIYIRFWENGNDNNGTFGICATPPPAPNVQDCPRAIPICRNVYSETQSYSGTGNIPNEINSTNSCLKNGERSSVWYTFTVSVSGNLSFLITPNNLRDDYDWAVYNLTNANCSEIFSNPALEVSCNFSSTPGTTGPNGQGTTNSQPAGGVRYNSTIPVVAGQTYVINVSNFTQSVNGYTIDFGASTASIFDTIRPRIQTIVPGNTCNTNSVIVNFTENILCNTIQASDFSVTGPGGPYSVSSWSSTVCQSGASYTDNVTVNITPRITNPGTYSLCLTNTSNTVADLCGNLALPGAPNCLNFTVTDPPLPSFTINNPSQCLVGNNFIFTNTSTFTGGTMSYQWLFGDGSSENSTNASHSYASAGIYNVTLVVTTSTGCVDSITQPITVTTPQMPTFSPVAPVCQGATVPALSNVSLNGISGTWNPSAVSNTVSGSYTFTPSAGTCATPVTINVIVIAPPVVYAHGTNPTCSNLCNGSATVDVVGGTAPYTYSWSNGGTTQTIRNICVGNYVVTVRDSNNCTSSVVPQPVSGCFQIQSILVDACSGTEQDQEMVFFQVGTTALSTASLTAIWPNTNNPWNGLCQNPNFITSTNATITGGGVLIGVPAGGTIPPNANVVLITGNTLTSSANSFANLSDTLYVLFQCSGAATGGHFVNNSGATTIRTLIMNFGVGCRDTVSYFPNQLVTTSGGLGAENGAYVNFSANGTAAYLNYGCVIPFTIPTATVVLTAPAPVTPTFNPIAALCQGASPPLLPASSTNATAISGSWSPAVINTTVPGTSTYTFTPAAGQCANTATLSVTVNAPVVPAFTQMAPVCINGNINSLPSSSNNNISGSWSPALNNTATTTYTFTPNAGQCAATASMTIVINPTYSISRSASICQGQSFSLPWGGSVSASGTYTNNYLTAAGCDSILTINLSLNSTYNSTINASTCPGVSYALPWGQVVTAAGTYSQTFSTTSGCDSIVNVILSINSTSITNIPVSICQGQNYNLPWGPVVSVAGTYSNTFSTANGCDSLVNIIISVNPSYVFNINASICDNESYSLPWGGTVTSAGNYTYTYQTTLGCDSIVSVILNVNPVYNISVPVSLCQGQTFNLPWGGSVSASGTYQYTYTSSRGCDSIVNIVLTVNPISSIAVNALTCGNQPFNLPWGGSVNVAGTYSNTYTSSLGCDSIVTINLTVNPVYDNVIPVSICQGQSFLLPWGGSVSTPGTYTNNYPSVWGCDSIVRYVVAVNPAYSSTVPVSICAGDSYNLPWGGTVNSGGTYSNNYLTSVGCDSIINIILTVNPVNTTLATASFCQGSVYNLPWGAAVNTPGIYSNVYTAVSGCDSIVKIDVSLNPVYSINITDTICTNQAYTLPWGVSVSSAGVYSQSYQTFEGCDSLITVNLLTLPAYSINLSVSICQGESYSLPWGGVATNAGNYSNTYQSVQGCDSIVAIDLTIKQPTTSSTFIAVCPSALPYSWNGQSYNAGGAYTVTLTNAAGCDSIVTLVLTTKSVDAGNDQFICEGGSANLNATGGLTYSWTPSVGLSNPNIANPVASPSNTTTYVLSSQIQLNNLISNGDFSQGNTGFTSNYNYNPANGFAEGTYFVGSSTNSWHPGFAACTDHTSGSGNLMMVNGATTPNVSVYCRTISVQPNTNYSFSTWLSTLVNSPAILQFSINGNLLGSPFTGSTSLCQWNNFYTIWNSGNNTTATICIVNQNTAGGGNDFALDDISFSEICIDTDTVIVTVYPKTTSTTPVAVCPTALPYSWNSQSYNTAGIYTVNLTNAAGCDSVTILDLTIKQPTTSITPVAVCPTALPYSWNGQSYNSGGAYTVTLTNASGCDSVTILNLTIKQPTTSTTPVAVCPTDLPYSWNGQSYNGGGSYTVTLTNASGCDSVTILDLTIKQPTASTTPVSVCPTALPYSWNSQSYNAAGIYTVNLTNAAGCDSVTILNLTIKQPTTSATPVAVCPTALPYSWNGQSYNGGGIYTVTLTNAAGCDSVTILDFSIKQPTTSTTPVVVCPTALPYSWNGQSYNTGGAYTVTLTNAAGCDSVTILDLTIKQPTTSTTPVAVCPTALPYSWNGQSYNGGGSYTVTLTNASGCDSVTILNLTIKQPTTSTTPVAVCPTALPYGWNGQSYNGGGSYTVTLTNASGCDSITILDLTIKQPTASTTPVSVCPTALPYSWNSQSYNAAGIYTVNLTNAAGCDSVTILNLTIKQPTTSATPVAVCPTALPYSWNGQSYNSGGAYTVTLTNAAGCDSVTILNLALKQSTASTTPVSICPIQLPYSWNGQVFTTAGTYSAVLVNAVGCDSVATLNLSVSNITTGQQLIRICPVQLPYSWNGQVYSAGGIYSVTLQNSAGCDSVVTLTLAVSNITSGQQSVSVCSQQLPYLWNGQQYNSAGTYTVTLSNAAGCDSLAILDLFINPLSSSTTPVSLCSTSLPYSWNGQSYTGAGVYTVTLTNAAGCDSVTILNLTLRQPSTSNTPVSVCPDELPYSWNGQSYNSAGSYTSNLTNSAGCDSIAILSLSLKQLTGSTSPVSICPVQLPYSWNGQTYTAAGIYSVTLVNAVGCDSVAVLNLSVSNITTGQQSIRICPVQLPYSWNGQVYSAGGVYSLTLQNSAGCDSVVTLTLDVSSVINTQQSVSICPSQLPYSWNGQSYTAGGAYSVTLQSSAGCDSVVTLTLTISSVITTQQSVSICPSQLPYSWNGQSYAAVGTYSVTLQNSAGCDSIVTLSLVIKQNSSSASPVSICASQLPYSWNSQSYNSAGIYTANLTNAAGCDSVALLTLTLRQSSSSNSSFNICPSQLPYSWNGQSYTAAGVYSVNLVNVAGCDSVARLSLSVSNVTAGQQSASICPVQLPYSWNGQSYTAAGIYSVTLQNSAGCDSVVALALAVSSIINTQQSANICTSQLPYNWNGQSYTVGGAYSVTLQNSAGCDSVVTLTLNVNSVITTQQSVSICPSQLPYSWNGQSYTAGGTYSVTLQSSAGCDSVVTLTLTISSVITTQQSVSICPSQLPYSWNGQSYTAGGAYSVTLQSSAGCDSVVTLSLIIKQNSSSASPVSICPSQLPYSWNGQSYNSAGTYTANLTNAAGCDSVALLTLTLRQSSSSNSSFNICPSQLPYSWNGQSYTAAGVYSVNLVNVAGCDSVARLSLSVSNVTAGQQSASICPVQLPYIWNGQSYTAGGIYSVILQNSAGCDSIVSLNLIVLTVTTGQQSVSICPSQLPYSWNGQVYTSGGTYSVNLLNAAGCDSLVTLNLFVGTTIYGSTTESLCSTQLPYLWNGSSYNSSGIYSVSLTSSGGCDSVDILQLNVSPAPDAPAVNSPLLYCQSQSAAPLTASGTGQLLWYFTSIGGSPVLAAPVPSTAQSGLYYYYVSQVVNGCEGPRRSIEVRISPRPELGMPADVRICFGATLNLLSLINTPGIWTYNNLPVADPASVSAAGNYQIVSTNAYGCSDTNEIRLIIQPPVTANAGPDDTVQFYSPYQLNGSGGGTYTWVPLSNSVTINNPYVSNPTVRIKDDTWFVLMVKDQFGCKDFDSVLLRVLFTDDIYVPTAFSPNGDGLNDVFQPVPYSGIKDLEYFRVYNRWGELLYSTTDITRGWDGTFQGYPQSIGNYVWALKGKNARGESKFLKGNLVLIR